MERNGKAWQGNARHDKTRNGIVRKNNEIQGNESIDLSRKGKQRHGKERSRSRSRYRSWSRSCSISK
jgi:hypothetical protein